jgi:O-antigen/teichoic acid export membrane protein
MTALDKKTLLNNISWTFFGNVIYSACQWAILSIIAKVGSSFMLGEFNLALALSTPIFLFSSLQLRSVIATDHKEEFTFSQYFQLRVFLSFISLVVVLVIGIFLNNGSHFFWVITGISLIKFLESLSDIIYGNFQQREKFSDISKSLIFRGITYILSYFIGIYFLNSLLIGIMLVILTLCFVILYDLLKSGEKITFIFFDIGVLKKLTLKSIPLGLVVLLISLVDNVPKYFVEYYIGTKELGIYSSIVYITIIGSTVVNAMGQASMTRLSMYYQKNNLKMFVKIQTLLLIISLTIGLFLIMLSWGCGKSLMILLYNADFAPYQELLNYVMTGALFLYLSSSIGYGITAARYFTIQPYMLSITLLSIFLFSFIFAEQGINGIAIAYLCTAVINLICHLVVLAYIVKTKNEKSDIYDKSTSSN